MNKKDLKTKYNLYLNNLILNTDAYKKYLTNEDIEKMKLIDKLISELLEKTIIKDLDELLESAKK